MNSNSKERFANRVVDRLTNFDISQRNAVRSAIMEEINDYVVYSPEEVAEIIQEPLLILEKFLQVKKFEGLSIGTIGLYKFNITHFISHTIKKVMEITSDDVRNYINSKVIDGSSISYANSIRSSLASFFSWMYDEEYINRNPMRKVNRIKHERELQPAYSEIEIDALRRAASQSPRELALIDFLLSTGCRVSEACNVDIMDIDFTAKKLRVIGKGNKPRVVYLTNVAVSTLKAYLRTRKDDELALFVGTRSPHKRLTPRGIQVILRSIGERAHVENVHPHRFRHTCCTRLLCRGMELQNVSRILGHSNVNTTMWYDNTSEEHVDMQFRQFSY